MIDLPYAPVSEISPLRLDAALGRYYWRYMATGDLLSFPDLGGGDLSDAQRREALGRFVVLRRPLTALVLFWSVVSFEDFIRDFGTGLSKVTGITSCYPRVSDLSVAPRKKAPASNLMRPDEDAFSYLNLGQLNHNYQNVLGIQVVEPGHESRLTDLAILRHTVAHHGAVVRPVDEPRFTYYKVQPERVINPPPEFVRETATFLYEIIRQFVGRVKAEVFSRMVAPLGPIDPAKPPRHVVELIEVFDYFGKLPDARPLISPEVLTQGPEAIAEYLLREQRAIREEILRACLSDLARPDENSQS